MPSDMNYGNNHPYQNGYDSVIECQNIEETILQRIRVCLGTKPGDVLGDPLFGIDLEDYIFNMGVSKDEIEEDVRIFLTRYAIIGYESFYTLQINVEFGKDVTSPTAPHDYFIIDVILNDQRAMGVIVSP